MVPEPPRSQKGTENITNSNSLNTTDPSLLAPVGDNTEPMPQMPPTQDADRKTIMALRAQQPLIGKNNSSRLSMLTIIGALPPQSLVPTSTLWPSPPTTSKGTQRKNPDPAKAHPTAHGQDFQPPRKVSVVDTNSYPRKLSDVLADVEKEHAELHGYSTSGSAPVQPAKTDQK